MFFSRADYESDVIVKYLRGRFPSDSNIFAVLYAYRFLYQPYLMGRVAPVFANRRLVARAHRADLYEDVSRNGYLPYRQKSLAALDRLSLISQDGLDYIRSTIPGSEEKLSLRLSWNRGPRRCDTAGVSPAASACHVLERRAGQTTQSAD